MGEVSFTFSIILSCLSTDIFCIVLSLVLPYATKEPFTITSQGFVNKDLSISIFNRRQ